MIVQYLLDSDICIDAMKRRRPALMKKLDALAPRCALSAVSYGELRYGMAKSPRPVDVVANLAALLDVLQVLQLPADAAVRYGQIRSYVESAGTLVGANDLWIAAHALSASLVLVTNNRREFQRVPGLKIESWIS